MMKLFGKSEKKSILESPENTEPDAKPDIKETAAGKANATIGQESQASADTAVENAGVIIDQEPQAITADTAVKNAGNSIAADTFTGAKSKKLFGIFGKKNVQQSPEKEHEDTPDIHEEEKKEAVIEPETNAASQITVPAENVFLKQAAVTPDQNASSGKRIRKPWSTRKKIIVSCILCVVLLAVAGFGIYLITLYNNPMSAFQKVAQQVTPSPSETASSAAPSETESVETEPVSTDPFDAIKSQADMALLKDIVNIMLIGVDHADERDEWKGKKAFHADVMIVLAINTKTNEVNMISLPRDTWAEIPGVKGIYKLNASLDCGGGWPTDTGFKKVCEAASWMLGGIPVQYYYAVDMGAVKELVNAINGVDYNIDIDFEIQGRSYKPGLQHMDGQAVLDYLRVRKGLEADEAGDLHRIDRQKRMLIAIFDKIKKSNLLAELPNLLDAFKGNLYTNTDFSQTAALTLFMKDIDSASIKMNAMDGSYDKLFFDLRYVFTDQKKRVQLIKQIYGIDVPESKYTHSVAVSRWANMLKSVILKKSISALEKAKAKLDEDAQLPEYVPPADDSGSSTIPAGYRRYGSSVRSLYEKVYSEYASLDSKSGASLLSADEQLIADIQSLCGKLGISKPSFGVSSSSYNEIDVDPR